jgi:hypothetical protein
MPSAGPFNPNWVATYRSQHENAHRHAHACAHMHI